MCLCVFCSCGLLCHLVFYNEMKIGSIFEYLFYLYTDRIASHDLVLGM